jgi:hypothetical protein
MRESEVLEFARRIGASPFRPDYARGEHRYLRSPNYFHREGCSLVIKISRVENYRGKEPFYGVLSSSVFSKREDRTT